MNIKNNLYEALINRGKILSKIEINKIIIEYENKIFIGFTHLKFIKSDKIK